MKGGENVSMEYSGFLASVGYSKYLYTFEEGLVAHLPVNVSLGLTLIYRERNFFPQRVIVSDVVNVTPATTKYYVAFDKPIDKQYIIAPSLMIGNTIFFVTIDASIAYEHFDGSGKEYNNSRYKIESVAFNTNPSTVSPYVAIRLSMGFDYLTKKLYDIRHK